MEEALVDDIIRRLLESKSGKVPKQVQLNEAEIKQLCAAAKEVFLSQPNLLELEAPIKICGNFILPHFAFLSFFDSFRGFLYFIYMYVHCFVIGI